MNISVADAARKMNIKNPQQLIDAENSESHITFVQLNKAAKIYDIHLLFYLDEIQLNIAIEPKAEYKL